MLNCRQMRKIPNTFLLLSPTPPKLLILPFKMGLCVFWWAVDSRIWWDAKEVKKKVANIWGWGTITTRKGLKRSGIYFSLEERWLKGRTYYAILFNYIFYGEWVENYFSHNLKKGVHHSPILFLEASWWEVAPERQLLHPEAAEGTTGVMECSHISSNAAAAPMALLSSAPITEWAQSQGEPCLAAQQRLPLSPPPTWAWSSLPPALASPHPDSAHQRTVLWYPKNPDSTQGGSPALVISPLLKPLK